VVEANQQVGGYLLLYNDRRPHSAHGRQTPSGVYRHSQTQHPSL
jgi:hypothetical protein